MANTISCPNCNHQFELNRVLESSIREEMRQEFNQKWVKEKNEQEQKYQKREELVRLQEEKLKSLDEQVKSQKAAMERELAERLDASKKQMELELNRQLQEKIKGDFEHKLKLMEEDRKNNEAKLAEARNKELDFLKQLQKLETREQEIELEIQRKLIDERSKISETVKREEEERNKIKEAEFQMRLKEKEKQLEDQRKLVEEMQRKAEQGSMQLQGEVQELILEQLLKTAFPFDVVNEVGKGVRGADCVLTVRNSYGQECGKIIFESKRTKDFSEEWIEKLKTDMRALGADMAVLVTKAMPKDIEDGFGEKNGVWVCSFSDVKPIVHILRDMVIKVHSAGKSRENMGDKMALLYQYLVSTEFAEQWRAIREGFMSMKISIQRERDQMEKLWKAREKQLEKVLLNAAHIRGSIEGIAGMDVDLDLLGDGKNLMIEGE